MNISGRFRVKDTYVGDKTKSVTLIDRDKGGEFRLSFPSGTSIPPIISLDAALNLDVSVKPRMTNFGLMLNYLDGSIVLDAKSQ